MQTSSIDTMRLCLLEAYSAGVAAVDGRRVVADWLLAHPPDRSVAVLALGKAAASMAAGAQQALGERLDRGWVVTKSGHATGAGLDPDRFEVCEGGHPIPDASSLAAGESLIAYVEGLAPETPVLVLISGGASALVEVPSSGVSLDDLARVSDWLLSNGRPIAQINTVRRRLSRLKGGGLAALLAPRAVTGLLISDVEGDDPAVIGSGPLTGVVDSGLPPGLPTWMTGLLDGREAPSAGKARVVVAATLDHALQAAEQALSGQGHAVICHRDHLLGNVEAVADHIEGILCEQPGQIHLWGGEVTLTLPEAAGRGGRNQHLALMLAQRIAGAVPSVVLCAGTDGTDGPTEDAGGLVDHLSCERGGIEGLSVDDHLRRADSGRFLEASGDLVSTGPTGTNVCDMVLAWRA